MVKKGLNYTPLDTSKLRPKKQTVFLMTKTLVGLVLFLTIGIGMLGYLLVLQKPIPREIPAYISGEATACNIKLGPPISGSEKIDGNKYSIQIPVENKSDDKKKIKLSSAWYACPSNDQQTCSQGDAHRADQEIELGSKEQRIITVTAEQPEGICGSLQIDLKLKAVSKGDDDRKDGEKEGEDKDDGDSRWDEGCNTNSTWVGSYYSFPQACGLAATDTPIPTVAEPTNTPTPTLMEPTPTLSPEATTTPEVTPTTTIVDNIPTPSPTSGSTVSNPTATSIPDQSANTPTPTEIVLVKATATPGQEVTTVVQVSEIPPAGVATFGQIFAVISFAVIIVGLLL